MIRHPANPGQVRVEEESAAILSAGERPEDGCGRERQDDERDQKGPKSRDANASARGVDGFVLHRHWAQPLGDLGQCPHQRNEDERAERR